MKLISFALITIAIAMASTQKDDQEEKYLQKIDSCLENMNNTTDYINVVFEMKSPQNEDERCFLECVYESFELIQNGTFNESTALKVAEEALDDNPEILNKIKNMMGNFTAEVNANNSSTEKCYLGKKMIDTFIKIMQ